MRGGERQPNKADRPLVPWELGRCYSTCLGVFSPGGSWGALTPNTVNPCTRLAPKVLVTWAVRAKGLPRLWRCPQGQQRGTSVPGCWKWQVCAQRLRPERGGWAAASISYNGLA